MQHALGHLGGEHQLTGERGVRARPGDQQLGRGGADQQPGGRAVALVQLLAGRRPEHHVQLEDAGRHLGRGPPGAVRHRLHPDRLLGQPQPGQPVPGGLDHHDVLVHQHRAGGLAQIGGQRADLAARRVVAAQRVVVGVADGHRAVRQHGDAQRVLEQRLLGRAVPVPEVEQAGADGAVHLLGFT